MNDSYGHQLNMSGEQNKVPQTGNQIFDLEDEDNMAVADQAVEDIEEYFLRVNFLKKVQDQDKVPKSAFFWSPRSECEVDEFDFNETPSKVAELEEVGVDDSPSKKIQSLS